MRYIFELNHPKHYYQFKYVMKNLIELNHSVLVLARDKDVLLKVLLEEGVEYKIFGKHYKTLIGKILGSFIVFISYFFIAKSFKPNAIVSKASIFSVISAKLLKVKSFIFPDSEVVVLTNKIVAPIASFVITSDSFEINFGRKHLKIPGIFENCYLSPNVFIPDFNLISKYVKKPFAIIRFVGWNANHDINNRGFSLEEKTKLVTTLKQNLNVYISSEKELPNAISEHYLQAPSSLIHHVLSFAELYVGDSQTMATESALLGTPSFRSNSFVGDNDMSNFKMLENKFNLLLNISDFESLIAQINEFSKKSKKSEWMKKKENYFLKSGDLNQIITDILIEKI